VPSLRPTFAPTPEPTWVYNSILFSAGEGSYGLMKYIEETDTYTKMSQLAGEQVSSIVVDRRRDEEPMVGNRVLFRGRCRLSCGSRAFCVLFTCVYVCACFTFYVCHLTRDRVCFGLVFFVDPFF
jgi:hypothetical protein